MLFYFCIDKEIYTYAEYKSTAQTVKYTLKTTLNSMVYSNLGLGRVHLHKSLSLINFNY